MGVALMLILLWPPREKEGHLAPKKKLVVGFLGASFFFWLMYP